MTPDPITDPNDPNPESRIPDELRGRLNQLRLRPQISREIVRRGGRFDVASLNGWIYAEVFRTPREDAWLGLLPRDVFTALPGDGIVVEP